MTWYNDRFMKSASVRQVKYMVTCITEEPEPIAHYSLIMIHNTLFNAILYDNFPLKTVKKSFCIKMST